MGSEHAVQFDTLFAASVWNFRELVAKIEFLEWTESDHLRHSKFAGLREDKHARTVAKELAGES